MITQDIARHLNQGKTIEDLLTLGYKKGTIYAVQRKLRQQVPKPEASNVQSPQPPAIPVHTETVSEVDDDPEILQLKKELRKAQLERQLRELKAPLELEAKLKALWNASVRAGREKQQECPLYKDTLCTAQTWKQREQVPEVMGTPVSKDNSWYVKVSALHCALCTVHLHSLVRAQEKENPLSNLGQTFQCEGCGGSRTVAVPVFCTACGREGAYGYRPTGGK